LASDDVVITIQIDASHMCCGVVLDDDVVIWCAPIVKYMRGWSRARVLKYCRTKGWRTTLIYQNEVSDGRNQV
jgi:hypothetical protein